jgi:DNA-binding transcriptional LysR family regulator
MLALEEEGRRAVREVAGLQRGVLSICALPALDQHLLPPWLAAFRREHPGIDLRVRELRPAAAIAEAVRAGHADLGFLQLPVDLKGLAWRVLLEEALVVVVPAGGPLAGARVLRLEELAGEEWVWVAEARDTGHPLFAACLAAGFEPRIACESGSVQGVLALVAAGLGVALLPRLAAEPRAGTVVVPLASPAPRRTLGVAWRGDRLSHAARAFLAVVAAHPSPSKKPM